jgi:hypothetical protein
MNCVNVDVRVLIATLVATLLCLSRATSGTLAEKELSGRAWVAKFPGGRSVEDLESTFRANVKAFQGALSAAGASIQVVSTYRPRERAYLMHWSWMIVKQNYDAKTVPAMGGVDINWWHGDATTSKKKAQEMVDGYGIGRLGVVPALRSRHTERKAIDMQVTWNGTLKVKQSDGTIVSIASIPRDSTNADLIAAGATYNVIHFADAQKDRTHWSTDGH